MTSTEFSERRRLAFACVLSLATGYFVAIVKWPHQRQLSRTCQRYSRYAFFTHTFVYFEHRIG